MENRAVLIGIGMSPLVWIYNLGLKTHQANPE